MDAIDIGEEDGRDPCMIAVPSMLIVAPNGTVKEATAFETPIRSVTQRKVTGIVAFRARRREGETRAGRILGAGRSAEVD